MSDSDLLAQLAAVSTPNLADAAARLGEPPRMIGGAMRPVIPGARCSGRAVPVRHTGTVGPFLEALEYAGPGDVMVVDNEGRMDEGCLGDLITLEVKNAGLAGIVIWGAHRDTADIERIGLPVFSLGRYPAQPTRDDPQSSDWNQWARVGPHLIVRGDYVAADADGVIFLGAARVAQVVATANAIRATEGGQAEMMVRGRSIREQMGFVEYLAVKAANPTISFRAHLRSRKKVVEV